MVYALCPMTKSAAVPSPSPAPATAAVVQLVPLGHIAPSVSNPRKHFDQDKLQELAESVKAHGVVQPLVVRPTFTWFIDPGIQHGKPPKSYWLVLDRRRLDRSKQSYAGEPARYYSETEAQANLPRFELVCGERRWRAARLAGVATVPCLVRVLDDKAVLEIQVIENLQREDVHPIEEAEGYDQLLAKHGYTVPDLVAKVGKSKEYIYGRLKLRALCPKAREAFYKGTLTASVALLVARIPGEALQLKALKELDDTRRYSWDGDAKDPISFRKAAHLLQDRFMLALKEAPFDTKDAGLPGGPCAACPKRTGNQKELFADVASADVCTDPDCFGGKKKAWADRQQRNLKVLAQKEGLQALDPEEAANALHRSWNGELTGRFDNLAAKCEADPKGRTYSRLLQDLGKKAPKPVLALDDKGKILRLVPRAEVTAALKHAGVGVSARSAAGARIKARADSQKYAREEELRAAEVAAITAAIVAKAEQLGPDGLPEIFWRVVLQGIAEDSGAWDSGCDLGERRGVDSLHDLVPKATPASVCGVLAELLLCNDEDRTAQVAKHLKLDIKAIAKAAAAPIVARHKAADAKKAAADKPAKRAPKGKAKK